jgi:hypothetical protein
MSLCFLDESGVPEIPGNSTHFVLAAKSIPNERWRQADAATFPILAKYGRGGEGEELHTAWLLGTDLDHSTINGSDDGSEPIAGFWADSLRRYVVNGELSLFSILHRNKLVNKNEAGVSTMRMRVEYITDPTCACLICDAKMNRTEK